MRLAALVCAAALACSAPPAPREPRGKPQAPVAAWIATRDLGGGLHQVTLVAVPATATPSLELQLLVPPGAVALGGTRARFADAVPATPRALSVTVRLAAAGVDVAGAARVTMPTGQARTRPALARLGAPAPKKAPPEARDVVLPGGDRVAEVRP